MEQLRDRERDVIGIADAHADAGVKARAAEVLDGMEELQRRMERRRSGFSLPLFFSRFSSSSAMNKKKHEKPLKASPREILTIEFTAGRA